MAKSAQSTFDEFDAYSRVFREVRLWRWFSVALGLVILFLVFIVAVMALKPPVVIVKDRASADAPAVLRNAIEQPAIEVADAESFFLYTLRRRYGWESPTIARDFEELHGLMTTEMGAAFSTYVNEMVAEAPKQPGVLTDPKAKVPRILSWMRALVRNAVSLDREDIDCRQGDPINGVAQWYCRGFGAIETQPFNAPLAEASVQRKRVEFRARFQPAPYDKSGVRIWGLGIAYLDAIDREGEK